MVKDVLYLKIEQIVHVTNKKIMVQDVAKMKSSNAALCKKAGEIVLYTVKGDKNEKIVFSALKVVDLIQKQHPDLLIEHMGEPDFLVEFSLPKPERKGWEMVKVAFLTLIVFFGAAFTIMTFNTDVSVGAVFHKLYYLVMGHKERESSILEAAYSAGIAIGILGFYNHFSALKMKEDPTPIHVEMRNYEDEMNHAIIQDASREGKTKE